jgi:hypothetical protein
MPADGVQAIEVSGTIKGAPRVVLAPGVSLRGGRLEFGSKGVMLTRDNTVGDIEVVVPEHEVAIYADITQTGWGTLTLRGVTTVGQVALIALDAVRSGHIAIDRLTALAADVRGRADRPRGFGVEATRQRHGRGHASPVAPQSVMPRHLIGAAGHRMP